VAEVEIVVLVAEQRERVVDGDSAQRRVDLVALDLAVVELVEDAPALVGLLGVALVELVVVLHRLAGDPVQILVERGERAGLELIPRHASSSRLVFSLQRLSPTGPAANRPITPPSRLRI
jgi:hypothetical protein